MFECKEQCRKLVKETLTKSSSNTKISKLREIVKDGIKNKKITGPLFQITEKVFYLNVLCST